MADGYALGWDSPVEHDGESYAILPEGTRGTFTVLALEKKTSQKLDCPMALLKLQFSSDAGKTVLLENLVLHSTCEWKICEFFRAIGQRKHGEKLKPNWNKVIGATGKCELTVETYKNKNGEEKKKNGISSFLDPEAETESEKEPDEKADSLPW
jgi:hypothetical protein